MKLNILPASAGFRWTQASLLIFMKKPFVFMGLTALFSFSLSAIGIFSIIGVLFSGIVATYVNVLIMIAAQRIALNNEGGKNPPPPLDLSLIIKNKKLIALGIISTITLYIFIFIFNLILQNVFSEVMQAAIKSTQKIQIAYQISPESFDYSKILNNDDIRALTHYSYLMIGIFMLSIMTMYLLFCLTPALIYWGEIPIAKAIFFNLITCIKNWRACLVWILSLIALIIALCLIVSFAIMAMAALIPNMSFLTFIIAILLILMMFSCYSIIQISFYNIFKTCYILDQASAEGS